MPGIGGVEATRRIGHLHPEVQVIALTTYADDESVFSALDAGARGYLTKDSGAEELERALKAVAAGEALLEPAVQAMVLDRLASPEDEHPVIAPAGLTSREVEVLLLIAEGRSNEEIADLLFVAPATVKSHVNHIFAKIGARDRAQAVAYAYRRGIARR
jgi:DNA-binding NarL/FixJ family response regulator